MLARRPEERSYIHRPPRRPVRVFEVRNLLARSAGGQHAGQLRRLLVGGGLPARDGARELLGRRRPLARGERAPAEIARDETRLLHSPHSAQRSLDLGREASGVISGVSGNLGQYRAVSGSIGRSRAISGNLVPNLGSEAVEESLQATQPRVRAAAKCGVRQLGRRRRHGAEEERLCVVAVWRAYSRAISAHLGPSRSISGPRHQSRRCPARQEAAPPPVIGLRSGRRRQRPTRAAEAPVPRRHCRPPSPALHLLRCVTRNDREYYYAHAKPRSPPSTRSAERGSPMAAQSACDSSALIHSQPSLGSPMAA